MGRRHARSVTAVRHGVQPAWRHCVVTGGKVPASWCYRVGCSAWRYTIQVILTPIAGALQGGGGVLSVTRVLLWPEQVDASWWGAWAGWGGLHGDLLKGTPADGVAGAGESQRSPTCASVD